MKGTETLWPSVTRRTVKLIWVVPGTSGSVNALACANRPAMMRPLVGVAKRNADSAFVGVFALTPLDTVTCSVPGAPGATATETAGRGAHGSGGATVGVGVAEADGGVAVAVGTPLVAVGVAVGSGGPVVAVAVGLAPSVRVAVAVGDAVFVTVALGVLVAVAVGVAVLVVVGVGVSVGVAVGVLVAVGVSVGVAVGVGVSVGVLVAVGVRVAVGVGVAVKVRVGVAVEVGVGVLVTWSSYAPMSQAAPCGRVTPRWVVAFCIVTPRMLMVISAVVFCRTRLAAVWLLSMIVVAAPRR